MKVMGSWSGCWLVRFFIIIVNIVFSGMGVLYLVLFFKVNIFIVWLLFLCCYLCWLKVL